MWPETTTVKNGCSNQWSSGLFELLVWLIKVQVLKHHGANQNVSKADKCLTSRFGGQVTHTCWNVQPERLRFLDKHPESAVASGSGGGRVRACSSVASESPESLSRVPAVSNLSVIVRYLLCFRWLKSLWNCLGCSDNENKFQVQPDDDGSGGGLLVSELLHLIYYDDLSKVSTRDAPFSVGG